MADVFSKIDSLPLSSRSPAAQSSKTVPDSPLEKIVKRNDPRRSVPDLVERPGMQELVARSAVLRLLEYIGEDPTREGLEGTPERVCKALREMTSGYQDSPEEILSKTFTETCDEVIISKDIPFTSICEHHLLTFSGTADIGYIPGDGRVVGLSKLSRLLDCFSKRLQMQERITKEVAHSIQCILGAKGVMVVLRASHSCQACRGVKKPGSTMVTSVCLGAFRDKPEARQEFLALCR